MEAPAKIECPQCHHSNEAGASRCAICDSAVGPGPADATLITNAGITNARGSAPVDATMMTNAAMGTGWSRNTSTQGFDSPRVSLQEGSLLADRYEILKLLGEGGM